MLDSHRDAIHALAGVVGTGIGRPAGQRAGEEVVIQIFVRAPGDIDSTRSSVAAMLGKVPFEVIVTGEAKAGD
jgi:hypothetical protein